MVCAGATHIDNKYVKAPFLYEDQPGGPHPMDGSDQGMWNGYAAIRACWHDTTYMDNLRGAAAGVAGGKEPVLNPYDPKYVPGGHTIHMYSGTGPCPSPSGGSDEDKEEDNEDEDDGYSDDLTEFFIVTQLNQAVGGIPVLSDTWRYVGDYWIDDRYWNNRFPVAPWQSALERLNRSAERALERPGRGTLNFVSELGTIMGVPTSRIFSRATLIGDEIYGELESESTYDFLRGAVTGQRSDLQRLSQ